MRLLLVLCGDCQKSQIAPLNAIIISIMWRLSKSRIAPLNAIIISIMWKLSKISKCAFECDYY